MPPDGDESWRDAALLLDMRLAAEDALGFVAGLDEARFLDSALHQSAPQTRSARRCGGTGLEIILRRP